MIFISTLQEDIKFLTKRFNEISNLGWINSHSKSHASGGLLFEKLIGKEVENFELPDFGNVEIKTKTSIKEEYITLFNATPDRCLFEIKRIHDMYGYPDQKNKDFKVFNLSFYSNYYTKVSNGYRFELLVDYQQKEVLLVRINNYKLKKTIVTSWSFNLLEEKLTRKLKYLLFIKANKKLVHNELYYKYYEYNFYQLKNMDCFIKLIEAGKIRVTFNIGVFRVGKRYGQTHDHGTSFAIKEKNLPLLFNKLPY